MGQKNELQLDGVDGMERQKRAAKKPRKYEYKKSGSSSSQSPTQGDASSLADVALIPRLFNAQKNILGT